MASPSPTPRPRRALLTRKHLTLIPCGTDELPPELLTSIRPDSPKPRRRGDALQAPGRQSPPGRGLTRGSFRPDIPTRREPPGRSIARGEPARRNSPGADPAHGPSRRGATSPGLARRRPSGRDTARGEPEHAPERRQPFEGKPARGLPDPDLRRPQPLRRRVARGGTVHRGSPTGGPYRRRSPAHGRAGGAPAGGRPSRDRRRRDPAAGPVRLTRRGKGAVTLAVAALTLGAFWLGTEQGARADHVTDPSPHSQAVPANHGRTP